jgi:hypothetical protein
MTILNMEITEVKILLRKNSIAGDVNLIVSEFTLSKTPLFSQPYAYTRIYYNLAAGIMGCELSDL